MIHTQFKTTVSDIDLVRTRTQNPLYPIRQVEAQGARLARGNRIMAKKVTMEKNSRIDGGRRIDLRTSLYEKLYRSFYASDVIRVQAFWACGPRALSSLARHFRFQKSREARSALAVANPRALPKAINHRSWPQSIKMSLLLDTHHHHWKM